MTERWLPAVGFEGLYEVSDLGRVRGLDRKIGHPRGGTRLWPGRVLKQTVMSNGYLEVSLCRDGTRVVRTVHSLVCEAFRGRAPDGYWVAHEDGEPLNCRADNLSWKTVAANMADKKRHGTHLCGEAHGASKLTERDVRAARVLCAEGVTHAVIADGLGVTRRTIGRALSGESWKHV